MRLLDRVAIVTGAGRGIGRVIAETLAREGARVVVADIDLDLAQGTAVALSAAGARGAMAVRVDVTNPQSCRDAVAAVTAAWDRLDILVNNAGRLVTPRNRQTLDETDEREWDATMNVNLRGTYFMSRAAAAAMIPRKRGAIVNIASTAARQYGPENIAYNVSKGGVLSLTGTLAVALAQHGIRVNGVAPMMTVTDTRPRTGMDHIVARVPLGKLATPEDVAGPVLFLASDEAGHVTGHTIVVDGGLSIRRPW